jgi:hypothetical protein
MHTKGLIKGEKKNLQNMPPPGEKLMKMHKQADRFHPVCVQIVRIWLEFIRTTCRLGFCPVYAFNGTVLSLVRHQFLN